MEVPEWLPIQKEVARSVAQLKYIDISKHSTGHSQEEPLYRRKTTTQLPLWKRNGIFCVTGLQQWMSRNSREGRDEGETRAILRAYW